MSYLVNIPPIIRKSIGMPDNIFQGVCLTGMKIEFS